MFTLRRDGDEVHRAPAAWLVQGIGRPLRFRDVPRSRRAENAGMQVRSVLRNAVRRALPRLCGTGDAARPSRPRAGGSLPRRALLTRHDVRRHRIGPARRRPHPLAALRPLACRCDTPPIDAPVGALGTHRGRGSAASRRQYRGGRPCCHNMRRCHLIVSAPYLHTDAPKKPRTETNRVLRDDFVMTFPLKHEKNPEKRQSPET